MPYDFEKHEVEGRFSPTYFAVFTGCLTLAAMVGAWSLDKIDSRRASQAFASHDYKSASVVAQVSPGTGNGVSRLQQTTVDYNPTGALPGNLSNPVILQPCTDTQIR